MRGALLVGLIGVVMGCGDIVPGGGGEIDAGTEPDAFVQQRGTVTVSLLLSGNPIPDALVMANRPDGVLDSEGVTGADGSLTIDDFPDGGSITLVRNTGPQTSVTTVLGVEIGDTIEYFTPAIAFGSQDGSVAVTLPSESADSYEVYSDCRYKGLMDPGVLVGLPGDTVTLKVRESCNDPEAITVGAFGIEGGVRTKVATASASRTSGSVTLGAPVALAVHRILAPEVAANADLRTYPQSPSGASWDSQSQLGETLDGTSASFDFSHAPSQVATLRAQALLTPPIVPGGLESTSSQIAVANAGLVSPGDVVEHDLRGPLPFIVSASIAEDHRSVEFEGDETLTCTGGGSPDLSYLLLAGLDGSSTPTHAWEVLGPGDLRTLALPELSPVTQALLWPTSDFATVEATITVVARSDADFAELRLKPREALSLGAIPDGGGFCLAKAKVTE